MSVAAENPVRLDSLVSIPLNLPPVPYVVSAAVSDDFDTARLVPAYLTTGSPVHPPSDLCLMWIIESGRKTPLILL